MATCMNRGVSVDAILDPSPFRSSLATDFARELVIANSYNMAKEFPSLTSNNLGNRSCVAKLLQSLTMGFP